MNLTLSVVICAHNPRADFLGLTLDSLRHQAPLANSDWDLIIVDNASHPAIETTVDLSWRPRARVVREERLGLAHARLRGFREVTSDIIVFVDDDNVLDIDYLMRAHSAMAADPTLGAIGGKSIARYESPPPPWFDDVGLSLACRDLGDTAHFADWSAADAGSREYPACAPIGAGMVIRRAAYAGYVAAAENDPVRTSLGRRGSNLASGEDNDMILTLLALGWRVGYVPELRLEHHIPARRLTGAYLADYACSSNRTWVTVLDVHGIRPWGPVERWTLALRKARLYATLGAWRSQAAFVRWRGACGLLDGQAQLTRATR